MMKSILQAYATPNLPLALVHFIATFLAFLTTFVTAILLIDALYLYIPLLLLSGFLAVRLFVIQHDCGHFSYVKGRKLNNFIGFIISIITLVPLKSWRWEHNYHHTHSGDLNHRGISDIDMMTVAEYNAASPFRKLQYRAYRHPLFLFGLAPFLQFTICYRFPPCTLRVGLKHIILHNLCVVSYNALLFYAFGWPALLTQALVVAIGSSIGVFLFYVQHNYKGAYWEKGDDWSFEDAAMKGSSVVQFGALFDFMTMNIAYHDVHHLKSKIPSYKLKQCFKEMEPHLSSTKIGFIDAIKCVQWKLWDEEKKELIAF